MAFAAARFGYREALDRWPDNTEARIGLVDALQVMARYALHREETDRVASHVDELASLHVEVHTLRGAVEEIHRRRQDESQRLWDGDYGVGHRPRILLLATIATFSAGVLVFALFKDPTTTTHSEILAFGVAINLVIWVAIWLLRPKLLRNQINRAIAWMIAVVAATVVVHRALAWMEPSIHSVGETLADDMLLVGFTVVVGALFTSWRLAPFGVLFIGGGCLAHMRPDLGILTASLMSAIGPIVVAALMLLDRTPPEDSPPLHP